MSCDTTTWPDVALGLIVTLPFLGIIGLMFWMGRRR